MLPARRLVLTLLAASACGPAPARVELWLLDEGALLGLAGDLTLRVRAPMPGARALCAGPQGGAWVWRAEGRERGSFARVDAQGEVREVLATGALVALTEDGEGGALWLERAPVGERLRCAVPRGGVRELAWLAGARALAAWRGRVLVGFEDGRLWLMRARDEAVVVRRMRLEEPVLGLGPAPGGWWVLCSASLHALDTELGLRAHVALDAPRTLAASANQECAWVLEAGGRSLALGPDGAPLAVGEPLALRGVVAGLADATGGVAWLAPGALLRLDRGGRWRASQGGFDWLVDGARASPPDR